MIDTGHDDHGFSRPRTSSHGNSADSPQSLAEWAEALLANAPAPIMLVERANYRLLYANPACRRLHFMPTTPVEASVSDLFDPPACRQLEALVDRAVASPSHSHEGTITTRSGERALNSSGWSLADQYGNGTSVVVIELRATTDAEAVLAFQVDMTERLLLSALRDQMAAEAAGAAEKIAAMANAAKDRFLTTMSHELRTPLNAIGGYVELIDMGLRGPVTPAQHEDLSRIQRAQVHLLGLINSVLDFAKLESGSAQFEMAAVPLQTCVEEVQVMLRPQVIRQGLAYDDLTCTTDTADPLLVKADPEKLRQILINLLTNAIKFTAPGGTVKATCEIGDGVVSVHIVDTGRGIPAEQLSTVFDPFVQVGRRLNSGDQGVGLGLSISRDLARGMGGELTVASTVGVGSTFTLTLDRASTDGPPSP